MVYEWKVKGIVKTDANIAGKVCEELNRTVGLTKETLLDASRPKDAPLHNEFEWDDSIAAEEWRQSQAANIIHLLNVRTEESGEEPVRAFYAVEISKKKPSTYENIQAIMADNEKATKLLDVAIAELISFKRKYKMLNELSKVFRAIDEVIGDGE